MKRLILAGGNNTWDKIKAGSFTALKNVVNLELAIGNLGLNISHYSHDSHINFVTFMQALYEHIRSYDSLLAMCKSLLVYAQITQPFGNFLVKI